MGSIRGLRPWGRIAPCLVLLSLTTSLTAVPLAVPLAPPRVAVESPGIAAAIAVADEVVRRQREDGRFVDPPERTSWQRGPFLEDWQLTRHADACGALFELYAASGEERFRAAAEAGLWHLAAALRAPGPTSTATTLGGVDFRYVAAAPAGVARLDTTARTLLAALEWFAATGQERTDATLATPRALGAFLLHQQEGDPQDRERGRFALFYPTQGRDPFPVPAAPGLATLALAQLAAVDPDCPDHCPWWPGAIEGAGWMMAVRDVGKNFDALPHDAPSVQALATLHRMDPEGHSYFLHARRIGEGILRAEARDGGRVPLAITAERALALAAVARISRRSGADDAFRFRDGAVAAAARMEMSSPDGPNRLSLKELTLAIRVFLETHQLDRNARPW